jgi:hypothetical protein
MRNVAMPMSWMLRDMYIYVHFRAPVGMSATDLKDVLERVRHFSPVVHEMLVSLAHDEI